MLTVILRRHVDVVTTWLKTTRLVTTLVTLNFSDYQILRLVTLLSENWSDNQMRWLVAFLSMNFADNQMAGLVTLCLVTR